MDSSSLDKESVPELSEMNFILNAQRVFEELGSKKNLSQLIDAPPKLLLEEEMEIRLHAKDGKKRLCKIFIFDKVLIVASLRKKRKNNSTSSGTGVSESNGLTSGTSSDGQVVWFADKKSSEQSEISSEKTEEAHEAPTADDSDSESDDEVDEVYELDRAESEARRKRKRYNLKMWIDLCKVKPRFTLSGSMFAIMITYVSKTQVETSPGEIRYETTVDQAEIWLENEQKAKTILGIIQEAVNKNAQEILEATTKPQRKANSEVVSVREDKSERSISDTDGSISDLGRNSSHSAGSSSTGRVRRRRNLERAKQTLRNTQAFIVNSEKNFNADGTADHPGVLTLNDIKDRYSQMNGKAACDEGLDAEYTVSFKNPKLGFALTSNKKIGPFVCRLVQNGLAESCGVTLGDRVTAINDQEIEMETGWEDCVKMIKKVDVSVKTPLVVTFLRKQKNEIDRQKKEEEQKEAKEQLKKEEEGVGAVLPVDESTGDIDVDGTKRSTSTNRETIELRKKTDDGSAIPKFTIRRKKTGKRRFAKKNELLQNMRYQVTTMKDYAEFKKNKAQMFQLYDNIESLFVTVFGYLKGDREKTCVHSLKEIYDTEYRYKSELNALREFHVKLNAAKRNVVCKHLKTGKPFCEHRRPLRFCNQNSSFREPAVEEKELNGIFLNLKPIMKSNVYLWKTLQTGLGVLYEKMQKQIKIEVHEILEVFCRCFTEIAPFLQIYWQYCQRYTLACEKQKTLRNNNEMFAKIVEPLEKKHKTKLPNLLSKPVQRVTRYHLLFTTLRDYTKKYIKEASDNGDFDDKQKKAYNAMTVQLETACTTLVELAHKVNVKVGEAESLDQMVEVYQEIGGKEGVPNLLQPHRRFISKHPVSVERGDSLENECFLYLFNDMLAVASCKSKRNPSVFAGGSKLSFPFRKMKNLSVGKDRTTSITGPNKKISITSGPSEQRSKRKSVRAKKTSAGKDTRRSFNTNDSKDSKDEIYVVIFSSSFKDMNATSRTVEKSQEENTYFGICPLFKQGKSDVDQLTFWTDTEEKRDQLNELLPDLKMKDEEKRSKFQETKDALGKKKKKKRFKNKLDKHKKRSLEKAKDKAKSSMYSKEGSLGVKKTV